MIHKDKYLKQLSTGCNRPNCLKAFCRKITSPELINNISEILSEYNDLFLCENTNKLFTNEFFMQKNINRENICINILLNCLEKFKNCQDHKRITSFSPYTNYDVSSMKFNKNKRKFHTTKDCIVKDVEHLNIANDVRLLDNQTTENKIYQVEDKNHKFCSFVNKKKLSNEEHYLLAGVLQILVKKYEKISSYDLGLIILRLYSLCSTYACKDSYNLSVILQIFDDINKCKVNRHEFKNDKFIKTELINVTFEEQNCNDQCIKLKNESFVIEETTNILQDDCKVNIENQMSYICLYEKEFIKNDLYRLVNNLRDTLNRSLIKNIRDCRKLELTLNIFYSLFLLNEKSQVFPPKKFYLTQLCQNFNLKEEYKFYRTKSKTILNYSFILPVHIKAELIKYENSDRMKASLQDSFFRSLFEGHIEPYLFITVRREEIYYDSIKILKNIKYENVHKQLRITFKNEEGVDSGGIRKEYFQLLSHEIKSDNELFYNTDHTIWIKNDCKLIEKYYCIGKILGIALYNNVVLNIPFPGFFFKKLLNKKTTFNDLREIDLDLHISLSNLKKLSREELEDLDLNFTVVYSTNTGEVKNINLDELGRNVKVTSENVTQFTNKYADLFLNKLIKKQFDAIKEGFYFVINREILTNLSSKELEKIILGSNNFNILDIKSTTSYNGYNESSPIILYFWEIFESFNRKMRKKLLQFITGHDRIPVAGSSSLNLVIMKNGCDTDRLPSSQTCFNTLLLPEYSSKDKLEEKLKTALEMTAGFFLL